MDSPPPSSVAGSVLRVCAAACSIFIRSIFRYSDEAGDSGDDT